MGFFDMDEFTKAAEDSTIVPHPLAEKLSLAAKTSYLGMVVFASLVDDGKLTPDEQKAMRETGLALKLPESDIDDIVGTVTGLKTNPEKMAFVKESLPAVSERDTAMFLYCDMVGTMTADGELSDDAKAFLSGMAKFLKISGKDLDFLNEYTTLFSEEKKTEAAGFIFSDNEISALPAGYLDYFTPAAMQMQQECCKQADYLTKIIDLLASEKGEKVFSSQQAEYSYEQKDILQLLHENNLEHCIKSSNASLLSSTETLSTFCTVIKSVMKQKFNTLLLDSVIPKLILDIRHNVEKYEFERIRELDIQSSDYTSFPLVSDSGDGVDRFDRSFTDEKTAKIFKKKYYDALNKYLYHTSYLEYVDSFNGKMLWHLILLKDLLESISGKQGKIKSLGKLTIPELRINLDKDYVFTITESNISCYREVGDGWDNYHCVEHPFNFYAGIKNGPWNKSYTRRHGYDMTKAFEGYKKSINDFYAFLEDLHYYNALNNMKAAQKFIAQFVQGIEGVN